MTDRGWQRAFEDPIQLSLEINGFPNIAPAWLSAKRKMSQELNAIDQLGHDAHRRHGRALPSRRWRLRSWGLHSTE
ncbi:hypothetical protein CQ10_34935 [Bradyrhizobium valentinum]|nr:hypothetical protein CQ10_34935 [Bradyrhizobium valentinum]